MKIIMMTGDESEAAVAQRPPSWFPVWPFVYLMGSELLLVGV